MVILRGTLIFKSSARAFATIDLGSGCEIGQQLYKEFGAGKLDRVDFQSVPTDEAQDAGYGFWRLDAARAAQEQTQASGQTPTPRMKAAKWI